MDWSARFGAFVTKKTAAAVDAPIPGSHTVESHGTPDRLSGIGNAWTMARFDGRFFESWPRDNSLPAINCVFVQSADGNTGADQPITLGGGLTDKHLIYEGLSSVHADAILTDDAGRHLRAPAPEPPRLTVRPQQRPNQADDVGRRSRG